MSQDVLVLSGSASSGFLVEGVSKLVQRIFLELLTEKGSLRYLPSRGTRLLTNLRSRPIYTESNFLGYFAMARLELFANLSQDETEDTPNTERLAKLQIERFTLIPGQLLLTLAITPEEGPTVSYTFAMTAEL